MHRLNPLVLALALVLWLPLAGAADLERGTRAFENGDYRTARYELEPLAEAGDADAQYVVGFMHALGRGYRKDLVQAEKWFILSARGGNRDAPEARDQIATKLTAYQLREAERQATAFRTTQASSSGSSSWSQAPETLPTGRALVAEIQSGLARLGFDPGSPDGLMGRRTRTAITDFQRQVGMRQDGQPTQDVLRAIRKAETEGMQARTPTPTAPTPVRGADSNWYFTKLDLDAVMNELRGLLGKNDDRALRSGVEALVTRGRWPWTDLVFRDDFSKGAGQGGLDWRVIRGEYSIRGGLLSDARSRAASQPARTSSAQQGGEQQVLELLGTLLGTELDRSGSSASSASAPSKSGPDLIQLNANIADYFLLRTRLHVYDPSGVTGLLLQRTVSGQPEELRLRILPNRQELRLEHVDRNGRRELARAPFRFKAGRKYSLEWAQTRGRLMQVAVNGRLLINDARSDVRGGYQAFAWRNRGGSYLMTEIEIHNRRRR